MWTAGLGFGHYNLKKPGTFRVAAQYVRNEAGAYFGGSTYTTFPASSFLMWTASSGWPMLMSFWQRISASTVNMHSM